MENHLTAVGREGHHQSAIRAASDDSGQFDQRPGGDNGFNRPGDGIGDFILADGDPEPSVAAMVIWSPSNLSSTPVRTGRAHPWRLQTQPAGPFLEVGDIQRYAFINIWLGDRRKFFGINPFDVGFGCAAFHIERMGAVIQEEGDLFVGQIAHKVRERPRRNGDRTFTFDFCAHPTGDPQLKIGRGKTQAAIIGFDQDI